MTKKQYTKQQLTKFKKAILGKMKSMNMEMDDIKNGIINSGKANTSLAQDAVYSLHMADAGTDSFEREKNYHLMTRENDYIRHLDLALERIEEGIFGVCMICGELIAEERMLEVPNATKCVECKTKEKLNLK